jgi:hypothetical protein
VIDKVSVVINKGAVSVTVPLLMVSVSVVVVESMIVDGVVIVVVSETVADSKMVLVTVPISRIEEQYALPSSAWRRPVTAARLSSQLLVIVRATAIPAEARRSKERYDMMEVSECGETKKTSRRRPRE